MVTKKIYIFAFILLKCHELFLTVSVDAVVLTCFGMLHGGEISNPYNIINSPVVHWPSS